MAEGKPWFLAPGRPCRRAGVCCSCGRLSRALLLSFFASVRAPSGRPVEACPLAASRLPAEPPSPAGDVSAPTAPLQRLVHSSSWDAHTLSPGSTAGMALPPPYPGGACDPRTTASRRHELGQPRLPKNCSRGLTGRRATAFAQQHGLAAAEALLHIAASSGGPHARAGAVRRWRQRSRVMEARLDVGAICRRRGDPRA